MKTVTSLLLTFSLLLFVASKEVRASNDIVPQDLPEIVVSYALFCSRYADFKTLEPNADNVLIKLHKSFEAMEKSFEALSLNFSTRLAFGHRSFIVQTNIPAHFSGLVREKSKTAQQLVIPPDGMFFVSTPIESFGYRSLVFLSSGGPERTTIVAVDDNLKVELLYDSSTKRTDIIPGIGKIDSIRVKEPAILLLEEKTARNAPSQGPQRNGRSFLVDVSDGKFKISRVAEKK